MQRTLIIKHARTCICLHTGALPSAVTSFNDSRCETAGVCSTDPLSFTCELKEVYILRVILPSGEQEVISLGDETKEVVLTTGGFKAVFLNITEIGRLRNICITLSIANASLLNGGEIKCDDTNRNATVISMAGCPLLGKSAQKNEDKNLWIFGVF